MPDRRTPRHQQSSSQSTSDSERIGIASGDTLTRAAHPRSTIANGPQGPDWRAIDRVLADTRPARIAVGEPYNADGSASPLTEAARRFAAELASRSALPVDLVDERWSSQDAEERLRAQRASGEREAARDARRRGCGRGRGDPGTLVRTNKTT